MKKRAQGTMSLPFGLIFSIFLILIFIVVAFMVGKSFLNIGQCSTVGLFYEDLQNSIDQLFSEQSGERVFSPSLPDSIDTICFVNFTELITNNGEEYYQIEIYDKEDSNVFLLPPQKACDMPHMKLEHLNISKIVEGSNPYCISTQEDIRLSKGFYDNAISLK